MDDNNMNKNDSFQTQPFYHYAPNIYINTNNADSRQDTSHNNQTNQILQRVQRTEKETQAIGRRLAAIDARGKHQECEVNEIKNCQIGELTDQIKHLKEQLSAKQRADADAAKEMKALKEKLQVLEAKMESKDQPDIKEDSNCVDPLRQPVEHCEDYVSVSSRVTHFSSKSQYSNHNCLDANVMTSESLQPAANGWTIRSGHTITNSLPSLRITSDETFTMTQTDVSQTCPKELLSSPSNVNQTCPELLVTDFSQTFPKVLEDCQTDISQTFPKVLEHCHTDAAQTRPKVLETKTKDNRTNQRRDTVSDSRTPRGAKYPPIAKKPDTIHNRMKIKPQANNIRNNNPNTARTANMKTTVHAVESWAENSSGAVPINNSCTTPINVIDASLTASISDALSENMVGVLTTENMVGALTTENMVGALTTENMVGALTTENIQDATENMVDALSGNKVCALTTENIGDASGNMVGALTTENIGDASELISLTTFMIQFGYFEITVRNNITVLELEREISQEMNRSVKVQYIYSKEHKKWMYSHRRNDAGLSLQKFLLNSYDIVLC